MSFIGWHGIAVGVAVFALAWCIVWIRIPKSRGFYFDEKDGSFEKLLAIYLDVSKFILGLAAGGIVLVVGSTAVGKCQKLDPGFASPLFLLAMSIFYGLLFMPFLVLNYESYKHGKEHTRLQYIRNRVLAYSALVCFNVGYAWLIWGAANR
jgi:hypothetical protein